MNWIASLIAKAQTWRDRRQALRELDTLQAYERVFLLNDENSPMARAKRALEVSDKETALTMWKEALERYPDVARALRDAYRIEIGVGRFDEADIILRGAINRWPNDPEYLAGSAWLARERGDLEEAIQRWARFQRKFPRDHRGYQGASACLRQTGRLDEAETLMARAAKRNPRNLDILTEWANVAEARSDFSTALDRWETIVARGGPVIGTVGVARVLRLSGRLGEAEQRLRDVQRLNPGRPELAAALARITEACKARAIAN